MLDFNSHCILLAFAGGVAATMVGNSHASAQTPAFKPGERIVFLGDSITQAGAEPNGYVTMIKNRLAKQHSDLKIEIIGAGISGNKVPDLQARLNRDVVAKQPTIVVIYIGINDVWHGEIDPAKGTSPEVFKAGLEEVVDRCTAAGARVIVCTPSVIGEKKGNANHLDEKLDHYADISREICKRKKLQLCDLRKAFVEYLAKHNPDNEDRGILTTDGVHLNDAGNRFVADTLLPHLGKQR